MRGIAGYRGHLFIVPEKLDRKNVASIPPDLDLLEKLPGKRKTQNKPWIHSINGDATLMTRRGDLYGSKDVMIYNNSLYWIAEGLVFEADEKIGERGNPPLTK